MLNRRGFTMIELLVAIVLLSIVGLATSKLLKTMLSGTAAQVAVATNQGNVRSGSLAIPLEFREIGYDTIPMTGATQSDLEAIAPNRLTFRAMRGMSTTCGTPTLSEFRIRKPIVGQRTPLLTDGFLLFVESDPNYGLDDQWVRMQVSAIDYNGLCGADSAIVLTLSATPVIDPVSSTAMAISQLFVGGPVRWYERMEYGPYTDPVTSEVYVGARSLSLAQNELRPMIGPLPDSTAFALTYYNGAGTVLNPASSNPINVRAVGISLTGVTRGTVSLAGAAKRSRSQSVVTTMVTLRNTLRQ